MGRSSELGQESRVLASVARHSRTGNRTQIMDRRHFLKLVTAATGMARTLWARARKDAR